MYIKYLILDNEKVITTTEIPAKVPILEFGGNIFTTGESHYLQIGTKLFLGPSGGIDDHIRHSCNPNCSVQVLGKRAILYSLYVIQDGTEITFDYSTTSTDTPSSWQMDCNCGYIHCRKVISGISSLTENQYKDYGSKGLLPLYITNPIFK
jgi:hypothetical protein